MPLAFGVPGIGVITNLRYFTIRLIFVQHFFAFFVAQSCTANEMAMILLGGYDIRIMKFESALSLTFRARCVRFLRLYSVRSNLLVIIIVISRNIRSVVMFFLLFSSVRMSFVFFFGIWFLLYFKKKKNLCYTISVVHHIVANSLYINNGLFFRFNNKRSVLCNSY